MQTDDKDFAARAEANQRQLAEALKPQYDFIVCGSGSSGSVVARRLAENPSVSVLLLEAGGSDDVPSVMEAARWPENLGSERDWAFKTRPNPHLNGRSLVWAMGKVLGGSSSINVMVWARGHKNDWDYFAAETGDEGWSYERVLGIYRRIEDWQGAPDPIRRGTGGPVFVHPAPAQIPIMPAMLEGARSVGIPTYPDQNGALMEGDGGAAVANMRIRDGKRVSVFRSYVHPFLDRPNLTVLTGALVTKLILAGQRAVGVEVRFGGRLHRFDAEREIVLSLGAINTPKLLMQSGIGDEAELSRFGIRTRQHLPGVGRNLQEHILIGGCVWEYARPEQFTGSGSDVTLFWKSDARLDTPDLQFFAIDGSYNSAETARFSPPAASWTLLPGVVRTQSRGRLRLTGAGPDDPLDIDTQVLSDPADLKAALAGIALARDIGNSAALRPFVKREVMPGGMRGAELENFVREAVVPFWHQTCTAKMGRDAMSVVDGSLKVYGIDGLRIADGSVMPRVATGNTMAPCVVIGERAADLIRKAHGL
ncbi:MAG TPA: GMC family oxidoreductase N-terminal domain-containing protein [Aliidongia sp.]|nr:GMC family oxidoreductase N-terminal domain-containing protein [Aliidongia sp.]